MSLGGPASSQTTSWPRSASETVCGLCCMAVLCVDCVRPTQTTQRLVQFETVARQLLMAATGRCQLDDHPKGAPEASWPFAARPAGFARATCS